ncbi:MAG: hypothetical protein STSR0009_21170 [Methanoregula sp.]
MSQGFPTTRDAVRFLTAHKNKGRVFPVVFVTDMAYQRFPQRNQSKPFNVLNDLSGLENRR